MGGLMANKTVLVIEDNGLNMKLVKALLERENHSVLCADNAEDGIRLAYTHRPCLIFHHDF